MDFLGYFFSFVWDEGQIESGINSQVFDVG
jgi:hypothetical protein